MSGSGFFAFYMTLYCTVMSMTLFSLEGMKKGKNFHVLFSVLEKKYEGKSFVMYSRKNVQKDMNPRDKRLPKKRRKPGLKDLRASFRRRGYF